jgi:hypothetical protein
MVGVLCAAVLARPYYEALRLGRWRRVAALFRRLAPIVGWSVAGIAVMLAMNAARFSSPLDFGYSYLGYANTQAHGMFDLRFLPRNLHLFMTAPPDISSHFPWIRFSAMGTGIPFTAPALLLALRPRRKPLWWIALAVTILCLMPALLYAETGWKQFGFRRMLDALAPWIVSWTVGRERIGVLGYILIVFSLAMGFLGVLWLGTPDWAVAPGIPESY